MAAMTLLELAQAFAQKIGIAIPAVVVAGTDVNVLQILACLNEEVKEHCNREWDFPQLKIDNTFNFTTDPNYKALELRNDATVPGYRSLVPRTLWNTTMRLEVVGPVDDPTWAAMVTMGVSATQDAYRVVGDWLLIYPNHSSAQAYRYTYMSRYGVRSAALALKETFTVDTDVSLMPSRVLLKGLEWRWLQKKGIPYSKEFDQYEKLLAEEANREAIPGVISCDNTLPRAMPAIFIPAGNWPLP